MLPGHVAGMYTRDQCHIDLVRLARFAGAQIIHAEAAGIDVENKMVSIGPNRPPIRYDVLSIDTGSTPSLTDVGETDGSAPITAVKPIDSFSVAWSRILSRVVPTKTPSFIVVVGAGAGGAELVLSMQARVFKERGGDDGLVKFAIVSRSDRMLPGHNAYTQQHMRDIINARGVQLVLGRTAVGVREGRLMLDDGSSIPVTECVWCAQASAAPWLRDTALALDADGFLSVGPTLLVAGQTHVFAAGDVASMIDNPRPKAGVFAVRQGPPLSTNIRNLLAGDALVDYEPQSVFLGLITTGDPGDCVASRGLMGLRAPWLFPLKDWIDRKWMAGYTHALPFMRPVEADPPAVVRVAGPDALALFKHKGMRCGGCGAKVGVFLS